MLRILLFVLLVVAAVLGFSWMKATALPDWYNPATIDRSNDPVEEFSKIIQKQGIGAFFSNKLSDLLAGKLVLDQDEFNALILTSIAADQGGQELLAVSDVVRAQIYQDKLEIGSVIDIEKLKQQNTKISEQVENLVDVLPALSNEKIYLAISGQPVAQAGELAFADDIAFKLGNLTISDSLLNVLGLSIDEIKKQTLKISYLTINDVSLEGNNIGLAVRPSF